eukprot:NODE_18_length_47517_cov_0.674814.p29 type:complete len:113 gc:universal NODE_18_length_47517_cov_0.674814:30300-30638(+)
MDALIVIGTNTSASVIQITTSARVKQVPFSKTQSVLEGNATQVNDCCKGLIDLVGKLTTKQELQLPRIQNAHDYKTVEMEQQVKILGLEKALNQARQGLSEIRKLGYRESQS